MLKLLTHSFTLVMSGLVIGMKHKSHKNTDRLIKFSLAHTQ